MMKAKHVAGYIQKPSTTMPFPQAFITSIASAVMTPIAVPVKIAVGVNRRLTAHQGYHQHRPVRKHRGLVCQVEHSLVLHQFTPCISKAGEDHTPCNNGDA